MVLISNVVNINIYNMYVIHITRIKALWVIFFGRGSFAGIPTQGFTHSRIILETVKESKTKNFQKSLTAWTLSLSGSFTYRVYVHDEVKKKTW